MTHPTDQDDFFDLLDNSKSPLLYAEVGGSCQDLAEIFHTHLGKDSQVLLSLGEISISKPFGRLFHGFKVCNLEIRNLL